MNKKVSRAKNIADIAEEQGRSEVALIGAIMAAPKEAIEQKVEDGILTQEQANEIIERLEQRVIWRINENRVGPTGYRGCNGGGRYAEDVAFGRAGYGSVVYECDGSEALCFDNENNTSELSAGNQNAKQWA